MSRRILVILLFILLLSCQFSMPSPTEAIEIEELSPLITASEPATTTRSPIVKEKCGNGVCEGPENAQNCPADCTSPSTTVMDDTPAASEPTAPEDAVLYLGTMIHLEGWKDDIDEERFEQHVRVMREYASLFETYGAKLTWESKELTDGSIKWGDNVLLEMEQRGHGVGVHADIGGQLDYKCSRFTVDLAVEKQQLESLGVTVRHLSGNTSHCDWVTASVEAGYYFTTGVVAYNVMSLPEELRPPQYRNCKSPSTCHDMFPPDLADRIHPLHAHSGADWLNNDPNGKLVIMAEGGRLPENYEEIDSAIIELEQAIALSQPDMVNIYYAGKSIGQPVDQQVVEAWLQRIQPYVTSGKVKWMTLPEMYDAYVAWEQSH